MRHPLELKSPATSPTWVSRHRARRTCTCSDRFGASQGQPWNLKKAWWRSRWRKTSTLISYIILSIYYIYVCISSIANWKYCFITLSWDIFYEVGLTSVPVTRFDLLLLRSSYEFSSRDGSQAMTLPYFWWVSSHLCLMVNYSNQFKLYMIIPPISNHSYP